MPVNVGGITFSVAVEGGQATVKVFHEVAAATDKAKVSADRFAKAIEGVGTAFASIGLAKLAGEFQSIVKESTLLAARVESLETVFQVVGQRTGATRAFLQALEDKIKSLGITTQKARSSLALLAQAELDLGAATKLTRIAQDAAVIAGINSSEAVERLIIAVQRGDTQLLRNLGIIVDLNDIYSSYATSVGRTVNSLSALEKRQVVINEVLRKGQAIAGTYEASLGDVFKQFTSLDRFVEEAKVSFGEQFLPLFQSLVTAATDLAKAFKANESLSRYAADLAVFSATATTTAASVTALVAAVRGAAFLFGGPWAIAIAGASTALGILAAVSQDAAGKQIEFERSIKQAGDAGAVEAENISKAADAYRRLRDVVSQTGRTIADIKAAKDAVSDLAAAFPQLEASLKRLVAAGDIEGAFQEIQARLPKAQLNDQERLTRAVEERAKVEGEITRILKEQGRNIGRDVSFLIEKAISSGNYAAALQKATEASERFYLVEFENNLQGKEALRNIARLIPQVTRLGGEIEALRDIQSKGALDKLRAEFANLASIAEQTQDQLKVLDTQREKLFKGTAVAITQQLREDLNRVASVGKSYKEVLADIETFKKDRTTELIRSEEKASAAVVENIKKTVSAELLGAELAKEEARLEKRLRAVPEIVEAEANAVRKSLEVSQKAINTSFELATFKIEEQEEALHQEAKAVRALENGLDEGLIRTQAKFAKQIQETSDLISAQKNEIKELQEEAAKASTAKNFVLASQLTTQAAVATRVLQNLYRQRELLERRSNEEILRDRSRLLEEIKSKEEKLQRDIAIARGKTEEETLEGVNRRLEEVQRNADRTEEFLDKVAARAKDSRFDVKPRRADTGIEGLGRETLQGALGAAGIEPIVKEGDFKGFEELRQTLDEFQDTLEKADTSQIPALIGRLQETFKKQNEDDKRSIEQLRDALTNFNRDRDSRLSRLNEFLQSRRQELQRAGVDQATIDAEINRVREEAVRREEQNRKEAEENLRKREQAARELEKARKQELEGFRGQGKEQLQTQESEVTIQARRNQLQQERLAQLQAEVDALARQKELLGEILTIEEQRKRGPTVQAAPGVIVGREAIERDARAGRNFAAIQEVLAGPTEISPGDGNVPRAAKSLEEFGKTQTSGLTEASKHLSLLDRVLAEQIDEVKEVVKTLKDESRLAEQAFKSRGLKSSIGRSK